MEASSLRRIPSTNHRKIAAAEGERPFGVVNDLAGVEVWYTLMETVPPFLAPEEAGHLRGLEARGVRDSAAGADRR